MCARLHTQQQTAAEQLWHELCVIPQPIVSATRELQLVLLSWWRRRREARRYLSFTSRATLGCGELYSSHTDWQRTDLSSADSSRKKDRQYGSHTAFNQWFSGSLR